MKKALMSVLTILLLSVMLGVSLEAAEANSNQSGQIMTVKETVEVKESLDEDSATIVTYSAGETVFVTGEENDFYIVFYQGKNGYVSKDKLQKMALGNNAGDSSEEETEHQAYIDALDEEMAAVEAENRMVIEEVERQREEKNYSSIWGIVIVVLVIGIFVTGIMSTVKEHKKEDTEKKNLDKEN